MVVSLSTPLLQTYDPHATYFYLLLNKDQETFKVEERVWSKRRADERRSGVKSDRQNRLLPPSLSLPVDVLQYGAVGYFGGRRYGMCMLFVST